MLTRFRLQGAGEWGASMLAPPPTSPPHHRELVGLLYDLVWSAPMMRLAVQFGISGRGWAKICERAQVPVPKPSYWAKAQAGHPMAKVPLPVTVTDMPTRVIIKSSSS